MSKLFAFTLSELNMHLVYIKLYSLIIKISLRIFFLIIKIVETDLSNVRSLVSRYLIGEFLYLIFNSA